MLLFFHICFLLFFLFIHRQNTDKQRKCWLQHNMRPTGVLINSISYLYSCFDSFRTFSFFSFFISFSTEYACLYVDAVQFSINVAHKRQSWHCNHDIVHLLSRHKVWRSHKQFSTQIQYWRNHRLHLLYEPMLCVRLNWLETVYLHWLTQTVWA